MEPANFSGAKLAVLAAGQVLALLRDNKPGIDWPGLWDLPGGGREDGETPLDCALRETWEEAGLRIDQTSVRWERVYANPCEGKLPAWFFVAEPGWLALPPPRLGDEGQEVRWMPLKAFLDLEDGIVHLQDRLRDYLAEMEARAWRASRIV
ncbi:MAG: NUDIX hydrolase [Rhodobacter sp.]|jgi:8-oxo-dGTP diphosphatase|nr:NUDIX hydrolase [Rhodobacter sp.]